MHSGGSGNWCESHLHTHTHTASSPPSRELCYHCSLLDLDERLKEEFKCRLVSLHSSHKLCCASWSKSDLCYCLVLPVSTFTYWHCRTFVADALRFIKVTSWLDNKDTLSFMRDNALCSAPDTWGGWIILSLWMCVYVIMPFHSPVCPESSFFQTSFLSSVTILLATRAVFSFHLIGSSVLLSSSRCLLPPLFPVLCFHVISTEAACLFSTLRLGMVLHNRPNLINHLHHVVWCGLICGDSNQSRMTCWLEVRYKIVKTAKIGWYEL